MTYRIEGFIGEDAATANALAAFLADNPGPVDVVVNSPGGNAFEGAAMLAELEAHGNATVFIRGLAASAASLIAMGGREIVMHRDATLMIHDPSAMTIGPASTHRKAADTLEGLAGTYAAAYARASGNAIARVRAWMEQETWLDAEEAVALNFADRIEGGEGQPVAAFAYTMFKHPPAHLVRMARENGWAAVPPESSSKEKSDA